MAILVDAIFYGVSFLVVTVSTVTFLLMGVAHAASRMGYIRDEDDAPGFKGFLQNFH